MGGALREIIASFGVEVDAHSLHEADEGIEGMIGKLKQFATVIGGALVIGEIKEFVFGLAEQAEAISKQSKLLGMGTTELQTWQGAAQIAGSSAEALSGAFRMMGKSIGDGSGAGAAKLKAWGVALKENGQNRSQGDIFMDAAEHISKIADPLKRNAAGTELFKRQWKDIAPLVMKGGTGIKKLRDEVSELGVAFDEEFIEKSEQVIADSKRLNIGWQGMKVQVASVLLPVILQLMTGMLHLVKPIKELFAHTEILRVGAMMLGVKGLMFLSSAIGPLGAGLRGLLVEVLPLVAAFLILEDIFVFLEGGDSATGRILDSLFGEGSSDKVRKWVGSVGTEVKAFIASVQRPGSSGDWDLFWQTLEKDSKSTFGTVMGGALNSYLEDFKGAAELLTGGWDNALAHIEARMDKWAIYAKSLGFGLVYAFAGVAAMVGDTFGTMWNTVITSMQTSLGAIQSLIARVPGLAKFAGDFGALSSGLDGAKAGSLGGMVGASSKATFDGLAADSAKSDFGMHNTSVRGAAESGAQGGVGTRVPATGPTTVIVNVPPGTDADVAKRAGDGAAKGVEQGNKNHRAAHAALTQGQG